MNLLNHLHEQFVIPVIRETNAQTLESICLALADGGLKILEITLMSDSAYPVIKKLSADQELIVGAGTVLRADQAQKAIDAGARFLVSPGMNVAALNTAKEADIPFIPGALTPTEIMRAQEQGCRLIKIFPISALGGAQYLKALQGPFPELKWMASGGISLSDLKDYMVANVVCVGIGGQLTTMDKNKEAENWQMLSQLAQTHVQAVKNSKIACANSL